MKRELYLTEFEQLKIVQIQNLHILGILSIMNENKLFPDKNIRELFKEVSLDNILNKLKDKKE